MRVVIYTALVLALASASHAAVYFVNNSGSPACSDTAGQNGNATHPWCTLSYALGRMSGGDSLYVRAGTYTPGGNLTIGSDTVQNVLAGTASQHTLISAYPGETVTIQGPGTGGRILIDNTAYLDLVGFQITAYEECVFSDGSHDINIKNNTCHDVLKAGIVIHATESATYLGTASYNVTASGNTVYNTGQDGTNGEGMYIGHGSSGVLDNTHNVTASGNTIHNTPSECIELKPGTHDLTIDGNTCYSNNLSNNGYGGAAIEVDEAVNGNEHWNSNPNHIVRNNVIHDCGPVPAAGPQLINSGLSAKTGVTEYNNVVYNINSLGAGVYVDNSNSDSYSRNLYNNTLDVTSARAVFVAVASTVDVRNNIGPNPSTYPGNVVTGSYFVGAGDYRLLSGSAPVNAGVTIGAVTTDIYGISRSRYGAPDDGAFEFGAYAATCNPSDVQTQINVASAGDTVVIPSGSCTWTSQVVVTAKKLSIIGMGISQTSITANVTNAFRANSVSATNFYDQSNMTVVVGTGSTAISVNGPGSPLTVGFRIHNIFFTSTTGNRFIWPSDVWGLIDHNTFDVPSGIVSQEITGWGDAGALGYWTWQQPFTAGDGSATFVEDNIFQRAVSGVADQDDVIDAGAGIRLIIRHNTFSNVHIGFHGLDSGPWRSPQWFEIYSNNFFNNTAATFNMAGLRGGSGLVWGNDYDGTHGAWNGVIIRLYRVNSPGVTGNWGMCTAGPWDIGSKTLGSVGTITVCTPGGSCLSGFTPNGNVQFCSVSSDTLCTVNADCPGGESCTAHFDGTGVGNYPCRDQVGRGHNQTLSPFYVWGNSFNSQLATAAVQIDQTAGELNPYYQAGRDYYIDGTQPVGYTPYTYPNPLQGGAIVVPGAQLSVSSLTFANTLVGATSASQTVTLTSNGTGPLTVSSVGDGSDYTVSTSPSPCGVLAVNATCTITVSFVPTAVGSRSGTLSVADDASTSPQTVSLSGTGTAQATLKGTSTLKGTAIIQ